MQSQGIVMRIDMNAINETIALGIALEELGRQSRYMQDLITCAYHYTNDEFNREIVSFAQATGSLGHMFEWGTLGINKGRSSMRPNPMSEQARLWRNDFKPGRVKTSVAVEFKHSVATVPKPTSKKTGIDSDILNKLKTHIFWNKAFVLENGIPVTIKPKPENKRKLLFVPNLWKGEKGYTMYARPTNPDISIDTKGTFSIFWLDFWEGRGKEKMQSEVEEYVRDDIKYVLNKLKTARRKPVHVINPLTDKNQIKLSVRVLRAHLERAAKKRVAEGRTSGY